ncbi:hypothetical protein QBC41DRAFT_320077 [Cercophora samala]|uniref:Uncharacterized protein n=1 Tax=Cercophora samala TaxID=330535 RepID=A0AA39ZE73_9PEZI|nr:hypothetical protein QBC41DRAFT_320077 [Cercophora samala]
MKFTLATLLLLTLSSTTALASPIINISLGTTKFICPSRVQNFCSASNVHSGCTSAGEFQSDAMDTCGECRCV